MLITGQISLNLTWSSRAERILLQVTISQVKCVSICTRDKKVLTGQLNKVYSFKFLKRRLTPLTKNTDRKFNSEAVL